MSVNQPPILRKIEKPTEEQSLELLKSIDSRLEEIHKLNPIIKVISKENTKEPQQKKDISTEDYTQDKLKTVVKESELRVEKTTIEKSVEPILIDPKIELKDDKKTNVENNTIEKEFKVVENNTIEKIIEKEPKFIEKVEPAIIEPIEKQKVEPVIINLQNKKEPKIVEKPTIEKESIINTVINEPKVETNTIEKVAEKQPKIVEKPKVEQPKIVTIENNTIEKVKPVVIEPKLSKKIDKTQIKKRLKDENKQPIVREKVLKVQKPNELPFSDKEDKIIPANQEKNNIDLLREDFKKYLAENKTKPDTKGLLREDRKYIKETYKEIKKQRAQNILENIESYREEILSKNNLSKKDKLDLKELNRMKKKSSKLDFSTSWLGSKIEDIGNKLGQGTKELAKTTIQGLLGPLNLILDPISETFGIKFEDFFNKEDDFKKKGKSIKPKRSDIIKSNPEIVWAVEEDKKNKLKETDTDGSLLDQLFGGALAAGGIASIAKQLFPTLLKVAPFAAIAGGLIWATIDGLKTVGEAEKWGVTKVQAFLGGFFSGSGEGWKNVVANAGKWGLTGLGIGTLAGGPIGAIAGLLVGSALGAIFGWIGAENTSQGLRDLGFKLGIGTKDSQAVSSLEEAKDKKQEIFSIVDKILKDGKTKEKAIVTLKSGLESTAGENEFIKGQEYAIILNEIQKRIDLGKDASKEEKETLANEIDSLKSIFYELKETKNKGRWSTNIVDLQKKYKIDFATFESDKKIEKVNDAIVTPQGRIIQPSKDDTIIATKSKVSNISYGFDYDNMNLELSKLSKSFDQSSKNNEIVIALYTLIDIMKNKSFNNIVQQTSIQATDFNKLRGIA